MSLFIKNQQKDVNTLIFITTIGLNLLFIIIRRNMERVVIPEYIFGTALLIYNLNINIKSRINSNLKKILLLAFITVTTCYLAGLKYDLGYKVEHYQDIKNVINYTSEHKENVYLHTSPALQFKYRAYSVFDMPPKGAFSNLRVIGGWDIFTQNYYDFKERNKLDGTLLDLLKDNVYLIDGKTRWSGRIYDKYRENVILAIKEHYNIDVECVQVESFGNIQIYKLCKKE